MGHTAEELISVALCTYNGAEYIEEQLQSILDQSYTNLEIIISDDCSSDDTIQILERYQSRDPRIKLYKNTSNLGFNSNFSKTLLLCSGNFIAISDQDDIWAIEKLRKMKSMMSNHLLIYHDSAYIDFKGVATGKSMLSTHRFVKGHCSFNLLINNCISGHACMIKKELLEITPAFPAMLYYDWWLAYTAACTGRISFTTETLIKYRLHAQSFTQKNKQTLKATRIQNFKLFLNHPLTSAAVHTFLTRLLSGYNQLQTRKFSKDIFSLLITNYTKLCYTRKRSFYANLKFILLESIR